MTLTIYYSACKPALRRAAAAIALSLFASFTIMEIVRGGIDGWLGRCQQAPLG
jgi:ABC-type amino acid transport system permease subunit